MKDPKPRLIPEWLDKLPDTAWPIPLDTIRKLQHNIPLDRLPEPDHDEDPSHIQDAQHASGSVH